MPAYVIRHAKGQHGDIYMDDDPALTMEFNEGWAIFTDADGVALIIPAGQVASIQRVDVPPEDTAPKE